MAQPKAPNFSKNLLFYGDNLDVMRKWIKDDLREMVDDLVSESCVRQRGLFRWKTVERVRNAVDRGSGDFAYLLWALLTLEVWQRTFLDSSTNSLID